jgi:DNA-binding transcriptional LysR family regulator
MNDTVRALPPVASLLALAEAVRGPTFAEAARRLRVSPSALTQQLKAVEAAVGARLFEPSGRLRRPTPAALRLAAGLRPHLDGLAAAVAEAVRAQGEVKGLVRIGGPAPFCRWWLRPRLVRLLRERPGVQVEVRFEVGSRLVAALRAGELDFAIVVGPEVEEGLAVRPIATEELRCLAAPDALPRRERPEAAALRPRRWIAFDRDLAMLAPWWRAAFGRREPLPSAAVSFVANLDEMLALCAAGVGLTVLPGYFVARALAAGEVVEVLPAAAAGSGRQARNPLKLAWRMGAVPTALFQATLELLTT